MYRLFLAMVHKISLMSFRLQMSFTGGNGGGGGGNIVDDDTNAKTQKQTTLKKLKFQGTKFLPVEIITGTLLVADEQKPVSQNAFS